MRAVVNVATGRYLKGQQRLTAWCAKNSEDYFIWNDKSGLPLGSPAHEDVPYAFKAFALQAAATHEWCKRINQGRGPEALTLLWCDASVIPIRPLAPLWERIERDGYWIGNNGWTNYEWTADSAYPELFSEGTWKAAETSARAIWRDTNRSIPHVVATAFGVNVEHPTGKAILAEYFRLASQTKAFCGPWLNRNHVAKEERPVDSWAGERESVCGPSDVRGHRHDQTALSVIRGRLGCQLTNSPDIFAYKGGEKESTILVADATYV